jgi:uncharacterized protein (DUF4415 family)
MNDADRDEAPELDEAWFATAKRAADVLPKNVRNAFRRPRGPQKSPTKVRKTVRLSPQVEAYFKRIAGERNGRWQTLLNDALVKYVEREEGRSRNR